VPRRAGADVRLGRVRRSEHPLSLIFNLFGVVGALLVVGGALVCLAGREDASYVVALGGLVVLGAGVAVRVLVGMVSVHPSARGLRTEVPKPASDVCGCEPSRLDGLLPGASRVGDQWSSEGRPWWNNQTKIDDQQELRWILGPSYWRKWDGRSEAAVSVVSLWLIRFLTRSAARFPEQTLRLV
jgi:hypothetical protein